MMTLSQSLCEQIHQHGAISFTHFMHQALYAPLFGYYSAGLKKFGAHGDFVTAPELTPLFGQALANQCHQVLKSLTNPIIFEFGAGSGQLCVDILTYLELINALPNEYHILEVSSNLRHRQEELIKTKLPHLINKIKWLSKWPDEAFNGAVIANEVLDAMPVARFMQTSDGIFESCIDLNANSELIEVFNLCTNQRLLAHITKVLPTELTPYLSEANLFIDDWLCQCYAMLNSGAVFLLDYGFPRHEYYHPDRHQGTLMCHYQHRAHTNAMINIGEQDITAHVDFTHVADAAYAAGFHVAGYTQQAAFLLNNNILTLLAENPCMMNQQAVKRLLQPNEMGELFKVIALTKQLDIELFGFLLHDKRASL